MHTSLAKPYSTCLSIVLQAVAWRKKLQYIASICILGSLLIWIQLHAVPSAHAAGNFTINIQGNKDKVVAGDSIIYSIRITNNSTEGSTTTPTLNLDANFGFKTASSGGSHKSGKITWSNQVFTANESKTYNVQLTASTKVTSSVTAESVLFVEDNFESISTTITSLNDQENQDISIVLTSSNDGKPVEPDQTVTFTVELKNNSNQEAKNVDVKLSLDEKRLVFRSASNGGKEDKKILTWSNLTLQGNASRTLSAVTRVSAKATDGDDIQVSATVNGEFSEIVIPIDDPDVDDPTDERSFELDVTQSVNSPAPDEAFSYNLVIKNTGTKKVNNVAIRLELDDDVEYITSSKKGKLTNGTVLWENIEINAGGTQNLSASVRLSTEAQHGKNIYFTASTEGVVVEDSFTVNDPNNGKEDIQIHLFAQSETVAIGEDILYTIRLRNQGGDTEKIDVRAYLDFRTELVSASDDGIQIEKYVIEWDDLTLDHNELRNLELIVKPIDILQAGSLVRLLIEAGGEKRQVVTTLSGPNAVTASRPDAAFYGQENPQVVQQQEITQSEVIPNTQNSSVGTSSSEILLIEKTSDKLEVYPGSTITYTVHVKNQGNKPLYNLIVNDHVSPSTQIANAPGARVTPSGLQWTIAELEQGGTWSVSYSAVASQNLVHGDSLKSTVEVAGPLGIPQSFVPSAPPRAYTRAPQTGVEAILLRMPLSNNFVQLASKRSVHTSASPLVSFIGWSLICVIGAGIGTRIGARAIQKPNLR